MITKFNNFLNEAKGRTYDEYLHELTIEFTKNGVSEEQTDDAMTYFHGKGYIEEMWRDGLSTEQTYKELKTYNYFK